MKISVVTPTIRPEGLKITQQCLAEQSFQDFEWLVEVGIPGNGHDLNAAYNRMLKRAKGELIVSLQDYIKVLPDYLTKFWQTYQDNPDTFITAPVGKIDNLDYEGSARWDWRAYRDAKPNWQCWEIDSGCAPKEALFKIGGFDEALDKHWSCDNLNVGKRAELAGYKFMHLFDNPALAYDHDAFMPHPFRKKWNPAFNNKRMTDFEHGLRIDYLS